MNRYSAPMLAMLLVGSSVLAGPVGWIGTDGKPIPDEEDRKSVGGFGGWLIVTPDADWEAKWNTPSDVTPAFTTADTVHRGESLSILIVYFNPRVGPGPTIRISCDFRVTRPDGKRSIDEKRIPCASGPLKGEPTALRLSDQVLKFIGEAGDPTGQWTVEVSVHDEFGKLTVPLRTHFELVP